MLEDSLSTPYLFKTISSSSVSVCAIKEIPYQTCTVAARSALFAYDHFKGLHVRIGI